jgi:hypothetical protein
MSKLIKFRLFGHIMVLVILYGFSQDEFLNVWKWKGLLGVFGLLYLLVLLSNVAAGVASWLLLRPFQFSWISIQSEHWLVFVVSLVIAVFNPGEVGILSFLMIFLFFYIMSLLAIKVIRIKL